MSESISWRDRYLTLIDRIVNTTLEGKIRSKEQVYRLLVQEISSGTGEIFEQCLLDKIAVTESQLETKLKASRILKALQMIQGEWEHYLQENQVNTVITEATNKILQSDSEQRLLALLAVIDPNQDQVLSLEQLQQISQAIKQQTNNNADSETTQELSEIAIGINQGRKTWQQIEGYLISWIYEQNQNLGFGATIAQNTPWLVWSKQLNNPLIQQLFKTLADNQSPSDSSLKIYHDSVSIWLELTIVLQYLQRGLVTWFDKQPYDAKVGKKLSISTYLTFIWLWNQLCQGYHAVNRNNLADACFQVMLQILRSFTKRDDFPLYGGIFASFSGQYLQNTLDYLDLPLKQVENTQEKARILTLLGYSQRALGRYQQAINFHQEALEIARQAEDKACEIANFNHLSRTYLAQKNYAEAINYSQRALILARQTGERLGEANALTNLGYSEVLSARETEQNEPETYETAINYLEQGLRLSQKLGDRQSQALCFTSLGIAYLILEQPEPALKYLADGWNMAQISGDLYLQGLNLAYLGETYANIFILQKAITYACLGMYLLEQIGATEWQKPAALLLNLQQQQEAIFSLTFQQSRSDIIAIIGVDGYDYIPELLTKYQQLS